MSEEVKDTTEEKKTVPTEEKKTVPEETDNTEDVKSAENIAAIKEPYEEEENAPAQRRTDAAEEENAPAQRRTDAAEEENAPAQRRTDAAEEENAPAQRRTDAAEEENAPAQRRTDAAEEESTPEQRKTNLSEEQNALTQGKSDRAKPDASAETAETRKKRAEEKNALAGEEEHPGDEDGSESGDEEFLEEDEASGDEEFFEDDEENEEPGARRISFRLRLPKIRIRTRKIAEQEKARRLTEEAALSGEEADAEDRTDSAEQVRNEERIIWIPAGLAAVLIIVAVVIVAAFGAIFGTIYWKYRGYEVLDSRKQEDTLSASYCSVGDNILRYSTDGASLLSRSGTVLWDVSYTMNAPEVTLCGDILAVYDKNGTNIVVCNVSGEIGSMSTSLPIIRAKVCESGAVAALMQDSSNAYVEYYDKKGGEIATIKTSMQNPGFPLDIAVSNDGQNIAVSYLSYGDSGQKAIVRFYNFGNAGQNQMDNRIADFTYNNVIVPQLEYLDSQTCVAFRSDGFTVYKGESSVKESATVSTDQKIQSVFHDSARIGMIVNEAGSGNFDLLVYNTAGRQLLNKAFNFAYRDVEFTGDEISLYNDAKICVFNMYGVEKFNGSYNGSPKDIFSMGKHRYVVVKENSLDMIRLK